MRKWYPAFLVLISVAASVIVYPRLTDRVPTHWDVHGQVNAYGPKWMGTLLLPFVLIVLWGFLRGLPSIDPRRANYAKMQGTYDLVVNLVLTLVAAIHLIVLAATLGVRAPWARLIPVITGIAFVVLGNALPRARPNWWFGIRTPWTLSNDRVWERTHRVGGYLIAIAGLMIVATAMAPMRYAGPIILTVVVASTLASAVYSYVAWRQETSR
jgi:uncharacterized membrane protein